MKKNTFKGNFQIVSIVLFLLNSSDSTQKNRRERENFFMRVDVLNVNKSIFLFNLMS